MNIQENYPLKSLNTFGISVSAAYFTEVKDTDALKSAILFAKEKQLQILFLGGGSNVLFTKDYPGLVIKMSLKGISEKPLSENEVLVTAKAGENWHQFVCYCLEKNYGGLENLSLIPGNVGTSPIQNIGAYGTEIKNTFVNCHVLNLETLETEIFDHDKCRFGYRDSIFKREAKGKFVIIEVSFKLTSQNHKTTVEYGAIRSELEKEGIHNPGIREISNAVIAIRKSKLPDPEIIGNAGSFFKNPSIPSVDYQKLKEEFPEIPGYPHDDLVKVPAGWLIEHAGWKGKQIGNVATHKLQSLVIINATGNATGPEIFEFSSLIINDVKSKYGIELEREVNII